MYAMKTSNISQNGYGEFMYGLYTICHNNENKPYGFDEVNQLVELGRSSHFNTLKKFIICETGGMLSLVSYVME